MSNNVILGIIFMVFSASSFIGLVVALKAAMVSEHSPIFIATYVFLSVVFYRLAMRAFKGNKNVAKA